MLNLSLDTLNFLNFYAFKRKILSFISIEIVIFYHPFKKRKNYVLRFKKQNYLTQTFVRFTLSNTKNT